MVRGRKKSEGIRGYSWITKNDEALVGAESVREEKEWRHVVWETQGQPENEA